MKVRATLGLTIDITSEKEMGLEIEDSEIDNYVIEDFVEYLQYLLKTNEIYDVITLKREGEND
jgi:hypothetical protein